MKAPKLISILFGAFFWRGIVTAFFLVTSFLTHAQPIWNGTNITFNDPGVAGDITTDVITAEVEITRPITNGGLYNAFDESGPVSGTSPKGTLWAIGTLANLTNSPGSLLWGSCPLEQGDKPPGYVGTTFVVSNASFFLQLTLNAWGGEGGTGPKSVNYTRSTAPVVAPTVTATITNPVSNAVFAAPANVNLGASATTSSGIVTNVQFYTNNVLVGSVTTSPFNFTANNLAVGAYTLTAAATALGTSGTSAPVNISVVTPIAVGLTKSGKPSGTNFQFSYSANVGLSYVIQRTTNVFSPNWIPLVTNVAGSNPVVFVDIHASNNPAFYRVGRLPNP